MKNFAEINRASTGAKKKINFFEKLWEHGRTLRRVGLVLVMCLIAMPMAWGAKGFFGDGQWNIKYWNGGDSDKWGSSDSGYGNDSYIDLGIQTNLNLKGSWVKTWSDNDWTQSEVCWYVGFTNESMTYQNKVNKSAVKGNQTWEGFGIDYDLIANAPVNPGPNTVYMYWRLDDYVSTSTSRILYTIPGFTTTSTSQTFDNTLVGGTNDKTISFGTHYGTALTTSNCSITGTNASEFSVRSINESGVTVRFSPTTPGNKSATLTITDAHGKTCTITLTAKTKHTVTYNTTGKDAGSEPSDATQYEYNTTVTVKDNTGLMTKSGKVFAGWATSSGSSTVEYAPSATFSITQDMNLYPVWTEGHYLISLTGYSSAGTKDNTNFYAIQDLNSNTAYTVNEVCFSKSCYQYGSAQTTIKGASNQGYNRFIIYDTERTGAKVRVYAYNKAAQAYKLYYNVIQEGTAASSDSYVSVPATSGKMITIDASSTKGARVYLTVENNSNLFVTEVIAIESGSRVVGVGRTNYELAFPGRPYTASKAGAINRDSIVLATYDNITLGQTSTLNLRSGGSYYAQIKTPAATQLRLTITSSYGAYVCTDKSNPTTTGVQVGGSSGTYNINLPSAGTYYVLGNTSGNSTTISKIAFANYVAATAPTAFAATATTSTSVTLSITDGTNSKWEIYYNTTGDAPTASTAADTAIVSKTPTVTGLTAGTDYYMWVRSVADYFNKSSWVALTSNPVTTDTPSCAATADAGDDKATKTGKGVAMAATAATSGYTGAWSIKSSSPNTSTSQLSSTSAYNATFTPTTTGTYTLVWTVTDDSDGSCYATDEVDVVVTAPSSDATFSSVTIGGETATISGSAGSYTAKIDRPHKGFSLTQDVTFTTNDANATVKLTNSSGEVVTSVDDHDFSSANLVLYVLAEDGSTSATYTLSITTYDKYLVYLTISASPSENIYSTISDYAEDNNYKLSAWDVSTSLTAANMASRYDLVILAEAPKSDNTTAKAVGSAIGNVPVLSFKGYMFGKTNWPTGAGYNPGTGSSALKVITTKTPCHDIFDGLSLTGNSKDITILSSNPASSKNGVQLISGVSASGWRSLADKEISSTTYSALLEYVGTSGSNKALVIPISNDACGVISSATETIIGNAIDYLLDNSALYTINTTKTISTIHVEESDDSDITDNSDGTYSLESEYPIDEDDNAVTVTLSSSCASYSVDYSDLTEGYGDVTVTVTAESGATGTYTLTVTAPVTCTAPTIGSGPSNVSICSGSTTTLSVSSITGGTTPYTYRWYDASDDSEVSSGSGYTTAYFTTPTLDAEASYYCIVTEDNGCTTKSGTATVSMKTDVSITTQPSSVANAVVGTASTLTIVAAGTSPTYQWYTCDDDKKTNAAAISSGSNASAITDELNITPGAVGTTYYYCVVDGCGGPLTSNVVSITAKNQPAQYTVSGTASICSGDNTNITLSDSEDGVSYQLYKGGVAEGDPIDGTGDAIVWTVSAEGTYTVKAVEDDDYWERAMSGSATVSFKTAASISTQPTTAVAATEGENFTLGSGMVVAGTGTKSYQWYSYSTSGGADETEIVGAESATYTTSKAAAGTYYYKVKVSADCGTATSNMITVTVTSGPCFTMTANTSAGSNGSLSHNESIAEGSDNCSDLDGGTAKYADVDGSASMEVTSDKGWKFNRNKDQIIVTLSTGYYLQEGSVITLSGTAGSSGNGIQINGKTVYTKPSSAGAFTDVTYTVLSTDEALLDANVLTIERVKGTTYLSSISISGCNYCEPITPTLTYDKTTFWLDDDDLWCSPTLNKDGSTGIVTYSSSDPSIVWVGTYGSIFAEKRGTATITASIAADGTHCAAEATCKIIVKSIDCGMNTIAKATRSTTTASYSGLDGGSFLVNNLDGSSYKLKSTGSYVGVQLPSSLSFQEGDKIRIDLKIGDYWGGINVEELPVVVYADNTGTNAIYTTDNYTKNTNQIVEFTVTSSMLTALNTSKKVTVYRTASNTQNHIVNSVEVKRYTCPDILVFNDEEDNGSWSNAGNWMGKAGQGTGLPKDTDRVYIEKSVTVDATTAVAGRVHVTNGAVMTVEKNVTMGKIDVETGSTLHVAKDGGSGVTLALNTLYLKGGWNDDKTKYDMPRVYINLDSRITKTNNTVNFDISVNHWNYYPIALPFDVPLNSVDYARSDLASISEYGVHYEIDEYNGQSRANYGSGTGNWTRMEPGSTLKAGKGYILSAITDGGKAIIRFPMTFTDAWTAGGEKGEVSEVTKNVIPVTAYENNIGGETSLANKGWNLIGVPYMSCYTTGSGMYTGDGPATLIQGRFDYETGKWTEKDANFYVTVPTHDFTEFKQSPVGEAVLIPGWCFFVQVEETGNLLFLDGQQASSSSSSIYEAPRREMSMPTLKTGIILSGNEASDQTTILVSDRYSASEYEINADLEKMFGETGYTLATYSLSGETRLAYNALSNADAANIIPIGYRAPADGDYTFSINPRYAQNGAFESVNLIDYETGIVTDLLLFSYTFTTTRTQNDARFALNIVKRQDTTTDIENGASEANDVRKLIINDQLYIIVDGKMYDATGKAVK